MTVARKINYTSTTTTVVINANNEAQPWVFEVPADDVRLTNYGVRVVRDGISVLYPWHRVEQVAETLEDG